jgi:predicted amidohydrolase YtcJ
MKKSILKLLCSLFAVVLVIGSFSACKKQNAVQADLVLKNGYIYTVESQQPLAQALAVKDGKFVYVGTAAGAEKYVGSKTKVIDLGGKLVLPGFIDSHCHAISAFKQFYEINLNDCQDSSEYQKAIRDYLLAHADAKFIRGRGWRNPLFGKTGPDKKIIDQVVSYIPVVLSSEDGHSKWVNSRTLELAGISKSTANPSGGVIERDAKTGEPTGTLRESAADLLAGIFPEIGTQDLMKGLLAYQKMAAAFGITTVHDSSLDAGSNEIAAYKNLERENRLAMRFRASLYADPEKGLAQVAQFVAERRQNQGRLFQTNAVKLFVDGVVEGSTAYIKEPYRHIPGFRGALLCKVEELDNICAELDRNKFQIHVHSIGDAATGAMLDALAYAEKANGKRDARPMLTHLQLVAPADILRFRELGVVALTQPYWFMKDDYYRNMQVPYLGQVRADAEYPMQSFFQAGVKVASSSDYPVTIPCNPLRAIQIGITRSEPGQTAADQVLWPAEKATLPQMIESFTVNGAYANFLEKTTGSIAVGKAADLIVLDKNLFLIPAAEISKARVLLTLFAGGKVFSDRQFDF